MLESCFVLWYIVLLFVFCVSDDVLFGSSFHTIGAIRWCDVQECQLYSGVSFDWGWLFERATMVLTV